MLEITKKYYWTKTVLRLRGHILRGSETASLRKSVRCLVESRSIVLDFAEVTLIDAAGLGLLLELREWANSRDIKFKLVNVTNRVLEVLQMTCLDTVFDISLPTNEVPKTSSNVIRFPSPSRKELHY